MRFSEFKILKEATTDDFYTVGDSHARGVGTASGLDDAHNLAVNGAATTGSARTTREMWSNISKIPQGASVLISVGANDTANVVKLNLDSQGKIKLPSASKIAGDVMKVVEAVKAQKPSKIVFMLFPSGDNKKTKYYAGDFQGEVREALRGSVGVKVIDYDGSAMQNDGIHYAFSVYKRAGDEARKIFGSTSNLGNPAAKPGAPATKDKDQGASPSAFTLVSTNNRRGTEIADIQKALIALGFPLPRHGVDGIRGPETSGAIEDFQEANGLKPTGAPDSKTVEKMNQLIKSKGISLKPSTAADVKQRPGRSSIGGKIKGAVADLAPLATDSVTTGKVGKILDFVARYESRGHYDIMFGGGRYPEILKMTLNELQKFQRDYKAGKITGTRMETAAAGRYQFMPATLEECIAGTGMDPNKEKFSPENQDKLIIYRLRSMRGLDNWLSGSISDKQFLENLSMEFASIPSVSKNGASYYDKVGSNRSLVGLDSALNTLSSIGQTGSTSYAMKDKDTSKTTA